MKQQDAISLLSAGPAPELTCRIPHLRKRDGRCYGLSFFGCLRGSEWTLVHGEVTGPTKESRMGHAWLEYDGWAYCPVLDKVMRANMFAYTYKAVVFKRYSAKKAVQEASKSGHQGPWVRPRKKSD